MTARHRTTRFLAVASALAAPLALAACSGGIAEDAPRDAAVQEFCDAFYDQELTAEKVVDKLVEVGTPDGLSDDERAGFELWVEGLDNKGDTPNDQIEVEVPDSERDVAEAFTAYVGDTCLAAPPTGAPSPSDGPTS